MHKTCTKCGETKPLIEFGKNSSRRDGLSSICKDCARQHARDYYAANSDKFLESSNLWRSKNKEKVLSARLIRRKSNKGHESAVCRAWRERNKDKVRVYVQNRRAKIRKTGGRISTGLSEKLLRLQKGKCACCGESLGDDYQLDHITPIALGGANEDWNIQLLRSSCNRSKHSKHPVDFMRQRGFLL